VSEYLSTKSVLPADESAAGCSTTATKYVASLTVSSGVIVATSAGTGASPGECSLTLSPTGVTDATIATWTGTFDGCAAKFVPSSFRP
jgi:hypothetical protein